MARVHVANKPASTQQEKTFEKPVTIVFKLRYLLYVPEKYDKSDKKWPLLVFLHGAGETGGPGKDLNLVKTHGPPKILEHKKDFPFIVVSPQSPSRPGTSMP